MRRLLLRYPRSIDQCRKVYSRPTTVIAISPHGAIIGMNVDVGGLSGQDLVTILEGW